MNKEDFIKMINCIKKQVELDEKVTNGLSVAFPHAFKANISPDHHYLYKALDLALKEFDSDDFVNWYCWENDFGKNNMKVYKEGKEYNLDTPEKLYNFIQK